MEILKVLADVKAHTPRPGGGYNLCGLDTFEPPGESGLYLISHHQTRKAAERAMARRKAAYRGDEAAFEKLFVYGPPEDPV